MPAPCSVPAWTRSTRLSSIDTEAACRCSTKQCVKPPRRRRAGSRAAVAAWVLIIAGDSPGRRHPLPPPYNAARLRPPPKDHHAVRLRRAVLAVLPLLAYSALAVLLFHSAWSAPSTVTVGTHGDPDTTVWYWAWIQHALSHGDNPTLTDYLNYPDGVNVTWQT